MAKYIVLTILEALAFLSCIWGLCMSWKVSQSKLSLAYNSTWFLLASLANVSGIIVSYEDYADRASENEKQKWLHRHYLMCWFTIIIGYPALVSSFFLNYYIGHYVHGFVALALIPTVAWLMRPNEFLTTSTQVIISILIPAQAWISFATGNWIGVYGAGVMVLNLISLSTPTRYEFFGLTARECFVAGIGVCSILFAQALDFMTNDPYCACYKAFQS